MYAEMANDKCSEMQLKFQDSRNPCVFETTPNVGGTGLNLTAANYAVITQKCWVFNEQNQAFAQVVRLGQNRVPHTGLLNTGPGRYDKRASDPQTSPQSGANDSTAWLDKLTDNPDVDDLSDSCVL